MNEWTPRHNQSDIEFLIERRYGSAAELLRMLDRPAEADHLQQSGWNIAELRLACEKAISHD